MDGDGLMQIMPFIAQPFLYNVTKVLLSTPSGSEMAVKDRPGGVKTSRSRDKG